ncbi:MAG TPA: hypothetical protein VKY24_10975, partial [Reyranella sp.]|nr:hypothetical protein [Reyranella sp.]
MKKITCRERLSLGIVSCRLHGFEPGCRIFAAHANLQAEKSSMTSVITDLARQYRARAEEARAIVCRRFSKSPEGWSWHVGDVASHRPVERDHTMTKREGKVEVVSLKG